MEKDIKYLAKNEMDRKNIQYQLNLCKLWGEIGKCIGPVNNILPEEIIPINGEEILY